MESYENQNIQNGDSTVDSVDSTALERRGGARPGAGRPPGPEQIPRIPRKIREQFAAQYKREMRAFAGEFFAAYKRAIVAGDSKILVDAANRLMGRPVTSVELSGPGGQPIRLQAAAAVALALSDPVAMSALAAFSRTFPGLEDEEGDEDGDDIAGELAEPSDDAPQDIIVRESEPESAQVSQPVEVSAISDDVADWLSEK